MLRYHHNPLPRHDAKRRNSHSNPLCSSTLRFGNTNRRKDLENTTHATPSALRAGFSLILGLVQHGERDLVDQVFAIFKGREICDCGA
jgi:hypothetical protein